MKKLLFVIWICVFSFCSCSRGNDNGGAKYVPWNEETDPFTKLSKYLVDEKNNNWQFDKIIYKGNRGGVDATRTILYTMHISGNYVCFEATDIVDHPEGLYSDPEHTFNKYSTYTFSWGNTINGSWNVVLRSEYIGYNVYVYPQETTFDSEKGRIGANSYTLATDNTTYFKKYGSSADYSAEMAITQIGATAADYNKEAAKIGLPLLS